MANSITGVGVRYYVPDLEKYLKDELHKGDIVYAMPDLENHHGLQHSVALFHHSKINAHVQDGQTRFLKKYFVNEKGEQKRDCLAFRYRGSHNNELGTYNLSLDRVVTPEPFAIEGKTYKDFTSSAIYFDKAPYVMDEERNLYFLAHAIMNDAEDIMFRDADSPVTAAIADELDGLLTQYESVSCCSLSKECKQYLDYIIMQVENLSDISDTLEEKFTTHYNNLCSLKAKMRKAQFQKEVYDKQLSTVLKVLNDGGFYDKYAYEAFKDVQSTPDSTPIDNETKKIITWIYNLPSGIGQYFENKDSEFATHLYNIELHYMDLYLVYAHIAVLKFLDSLHGKWRKTGPFKIDLGEQTVINNIIQSVNIDSKKEQK